MPDPVSAFRSAALKTLGLSIPALVAVCTAVLGLDGTAQALMLWPLQIVGAFLCMIAFIWFTAPVAATGCAQSFLLMGCYFVVVFLLGAVMGSATSMVVYREFSLWDYVAKPVYWMALFGLAPAFVLGVIGASILRRSIADTE